jgi:hypothetical protein
MNRIAFEEDSESGRHGAAAQMVAGLESIMDEHSGELYFRIFSTRDVLPACLVGSDHLLF